MMLMCLCIDLYAYVYVCTVESSDLWLNLSRESYIEVPVLVSCGYVYVSWYVDTSHLCRCELVTHNLPG